MNIQTITEFEAGPEPLWYMTKGHVDKNDFVDAVRDQRERCIPLESVQHIYMRYVPSGDQSTIVVAKEPGRGVFKATIVDLLTINVAEYANALGDVLDLLEEMEHDGDPDPVTTGH